MNKDMEQLKEESRAFAHRMILWAILISGLIGMVVFINWITSFIG